MNTNQAQRLMHLTFSFNHETKQFEYFFRAQRPEGEKYNAYKYFDDRETSAFLNHVMPFDYIQCTWVLTQEGVDEAQKVLIEGLSAKTVPGFPPELEEWEYFTGTARDRIKAVFVRKGLRLSLGEIGLQVDLTPDGKKSLSEKAATAMKRLNRLLAPVEFAKFGQVIEEKGDVSTILTEQDETIQIRILPADAYTDGMNTLSPRGAQLLFGLPDPRIGDGCRITACGPFGLAKGHAMVIDMKYDAVFYGVKPETRYLNGFYCGRLSELHVSDPNTDFQSLINFFTLNHGLDLMVKLIEKFFNAQKEAIVDSDRFRKMMLDVIDRNPDTDWVRARAAALGLDACFPGLFRSDVSMLRTAINRSREGVVPMMGMATRRYVMPSPFIFDDEGNCDPKRDRLSGNCVFSPGIPAGPVVLYRQPNGNVDEHWITRSVETPFSHGRGLHMGRGQIIYLGADMIPGALAAMGGGDFDDPVIVVYDPEAVEHFRDLPHYPKTAPKPKVKPQEFQVTSRFTSALRSQVNPNVWSLRHLLGQIADQMQTTGIGVVVNAIMYDTLMTIGKTSMLEDLAAQLEKLGDDPQKEQERGRLMEAYTWLSERPDYVLREIASDLESRIDSIKMLGGGGMSEDEQAIADMYDTSLVFPWCWTLGGFAGHGRIPERVAQFNPVVAKTQLCKILTDVPVLIQMLEDEFLLVEWQLVRPLPSELLSKYPRRPDIQEFVSDIRQYWSEEWTAARERGSLSTAEGVRMVFQRLTAAIEDQFLDSDYDQERDAVAVELARRIYNRTYFTPPLNEDGVATHVNDGLLWSGPLGMAFLQALEKAGLTGQVVKVHDLRVHINKGEVWPITVKNGLVFDRENGRQIARVILPDGNYMLDAGFIVVKQAHSTMRLNWTLPDEQR